MMVGALLTKCGCEICTSNLPTLPTSLYKLTKGFTGSLDYLYNNYSDGFSITGPVPIDVAIVGGNGFRCVNDFITQYSSTGPFPLDPTFLNWGPDTFEIENYLLIYGIYSKTQGSVSWSMVDTSLESITGGYAREGTNSVLITGGIPLNRYVYEYNLIGSGPTGRNNEPDFRYEQFEEPVDCCCGGTGELDPACPLINFASVTGGITFVDRTITTSKFNSTEYGTLFLKYPGRAATTYYAFTINLADNATNNSKSWQAIISSGNVTLQSSAGDVAGPYSGTLTSIINNLSTHSTWFSSVVLNSNFIFDGAETRALGTDLPNWSSPPIQRGVNGTDIKVPILFAGYNVAPSTYPCGFYSFSGNPYFANNFSSVVGTFSYTDDISGYLLYLQDKRYAKKNTFIENNEFRGLYYTDEYDSWLQAGEGNTWSRTSGPSVNTRSYIISGLTQLSAEFSLSFNECYYTSTPPVPEFGGFSCDSGELNGPTGNCPSNDAWLLVYDYVQFPAFIGINDCFGNSLCLCDSWTGPGPAPMTDCCVCGQGSTLSLPFPTQNTTATQTLYGEWYLTSL